MTVRAINHLIAQGTPVLGVYVDPAAVAWVTGRLSRVRRRGLTWQAQPWGRATWRELKSYRQVWVDRQDEEGSDA